MLAEHPEIAGTADRRLGRVRNFVFAFAGRGFGVDLTGQQGLELGIIETDERQVVVLGQQVVQLGRQQRLIPGPEFRQLVVRDAIGPPLRLGQMPEHDDRGLSQSQLRGGQHPAMARDQFSVVGDDPEAFRPMGLIVRQTRQRWGSMSPAGRLLLNRRLVQAPVDAIDYVITHELCHVAEPHHGATFFDLLDKVMPDWERRKQSLERAMA